VDRGINDNEEKTKRAKTEVPKDEKQRGQYTEGKARYASTIKKEKFSSWKEHCNFTSSTNLWNEV
jgi:hypothetical protein